MLRLMRQEIEQALSSKLYLAALVDALSLLDGVSKVEYPDEKSQSLRYINWWNNFAKRQNDSLDGDTVYQIRCFIMHETKMAMHSNNPNNVNYIGNLNLYIADDADAFIWFNSDFEFKGVHFYNLNLVGFCHQVMNSFDKYYDSHKQKINVVDTELNVTTEQDMTLWRTNKSLAIERVVSNITVMKNQCFEKND